MKFEKWKGGASIPLHDQPCTGSVPATSRFPPYSDVACLRAGGPSLSFRILPHDDMQIVAVLGARLEIEGRDATPWGNEAMDSQRGDWRRAFFGIDQSCAREHHRQPQGSQFFEPGSRFNEYTYYRHRNKLHPEEGKNCGGLCIGGAVFLFWTSPAAHSLAGAKPDGFSDLRTHGGTVV